MEAYFQTILNARSKIETARRVEDETAILAKRMSEFKTPVEIIRGSSGNQFKDEKLNVDKGDLIYKDGKLGKEMNESNFLFKRSSDEVRKLLKNNSSVPVELLESMMKIEESLEHYLATVLMEFEQLNRELRVDLNITMAKMLHLASVVGKPNSAFEKPDLFSQSGNFKDAIDQLETKEFQISIDIKSAMQRLLFLELPNQSGEQVSMQVFDKKMQKI